MKAKYYTYRNLNRGELFSTKQHGIVQGYSVMAVIHDAKFQVSEAGRKRCLATKKRNVHAFVVSNEMPHTLCKREFIPALEDLQEVKYNPYKADAFVNTVTGQPITEAKWVYLFDGRCYVYSHK